MAFGWGRVSKVMVSPQRHPKTGTYRFRKAVPAALQVQVAAVLDRPEGRTTELIQSLGTKDIREAKRLMAAAIQWADDILDAAKAGARPLTHRQMHGLAGVWYRRTLAEWERDPALALQWERWREDAHIDSRTGDPDPLPMFYVTELLDAEHVVTTPASKVELGKLLTARLWQALVQWDKQADGDFSPDPRLETFPAWEPPLRARKGTPKVSLQSLFDGWTATAVVKPRTVAEARSSLSIFAAHLGHDDASRVTRADLAAWRDASKAAGLTNNTFNNRLSHLRNLFEWGVREGMIPTNPADAKLRLAKSKAATRLPYSDAETVQILQAARKETRASLRWVPWILAFTGMRAGEAFQLSVSDLRQDGGIDFFAVHEDDEGKSVKSGERRNVPMHSALIREGLLDYARSLPDQAGPLFPDKKVDPHGNRGGRAWTVTGKWVRKVVGITDPQKAPNHSFRHRLEDEMRNAEIPEDARDAIVGHARKTTGRLYGTRGEALKRLKRDLERVQPPPGLF